jgi:hypothetical protein
VSLGYMRRTGISGQSRMNTASQCYSDFFGVAPSRTGSRFDTVEVRSSSLLVPTISFCGLDGNSPKNYTRNSTHTALDILRLRAEPSSNLFFNGLQPGRLSRRPYAKLAATVQQTHQVQHSVVVAVLA